MLISFSVFSSSFSSSSSSFSSSFSSSSFSCLSSSSGIVDIDSFLHPSNPSLISKRGKYFSSINLFGLIFAESLIGGEYIFSNIIDSL